MVHNEEIDRILAAIRERIDLSPLSQRRLEQRAGFSRGYLSQILHRNLELKVVHLIAILEALGVTPAAFFQALYPDPRRPGLAYFARTDPPAPSGNDQRRDVARGDMDEMHDAGLASLRRLRERLERCEDAVAQLEDLGVLDHRPEPEIP